MYLPPRLVNKHTYTVIGRRVLGNIKIRMKNARLSEGKTVEIYNCEL